MKNKWNLFWKDYFDMTYTGVRFYKKHWLGMIIYTVICGLMLFISMTDAIDGFLDSVDSLIWKIRFKLKKTE